MRGGHGWLLERIEKGRSGRATLRDLGVELG
jgi:hypothetical protein